MAEHDHDHDHGGSHDHEHDHGFDQGTGGDFDRGDPAGEEMRRALAEELLRMRPGDLLAQTAVMLTNQAAIRLGLASPEHADRAQAREAIDALAGIVELLAPLSDPRDLEALRADLAQLRMAYVQSQPPGPGAAPASAPAPEPAPAAEPEEERPSIWTPGGEV